MSGIIVMGHGTFASGIVHSVEMITGKQHDLAWIDFAGHEDIAVLCEKLLIAYDQMHGTDLLIACDVLYGTPCKAALTYAHERSNVIVIAGVNSPLLIQLCIEKETSMLTGDRIQKIIKEAKETMMIVEL